MHDREALNLPWLEVLGIAPPKLSLADNVCCMGHSLPFAACFCGFYYGFATSRMGSRWLSMSCWAVEQPDTCYSAHSGEIRGVLLVDRHGSCFGPP